MTRGKIFLIGSGKKLYTSIEFNGDMYIENGHGEDIIEWYKKNGIPSFDGFEQFVKTFNEDRFGYANERLVYEVTAKSMKKCPYEKMACSKCIWEDSCQIAFDFMGCDDVFDLTKHYRLSDYSYWFNGSGEAIRMKGKEGTIEVPDGSLVVFHYSRFTMLCNGDDVEASEETKILKNAGYDPEKDNIVIMTQEEFLREHLDGVPVWAQEYMDMDRLTADIINSGCGTYIALPAGKVAEILPTQS